jgi:hypothetical protein
MSFQLNCDVCGRNVPASNDTLPGGWVRISYEQYNFMGYGLTLPTEICAPCFSYIRDFIKKHKDGRAAITA